jgi:chitodextrinase
MVFVIALGLMTIVGTGGGGGGGESSPQPASEDKIDISGTVSTPAGISPDSLTITSLGDTSSVGTAGEFSTKAYKDGVTAIAAMPAGKDFGLMNVVATSTSGTSSSKKVMKVAAAYKNDSTNSVDLNAQTTAVSMVFVTPYFATTDPVKAKDILQIIENDPKVPDLAKVIGNVFNEDDPMEDPALQDALGNAIQSVLDTIQANSQSSSKTIITSASHPMKIIMLPKRTEEFRKKLTKKTEAPYSIDTDYTELNISESSQGYNIDVDSRQANPVDWIGEVAELDSFQFSSLDNLKEKATIASRFNVYDRESTIGRDTAKAKGFLRWIDFIGTSIDTAFNYFSSDGVTINSDKDGVYIVRSFDGGGWGADSSERDFLPQLPNGKNNDSKALVLNCISVATDVVSMVVDIKDMGDTACMVNIISDVIEEFPAIGNDPTTLDIIQIAGSALGDITLGLAKCTVKDASKNLLKFVGKVIKEAGKKVGDIASGYQWLQMAGSVGKITERAVKLYEYATPLESIFIVVGSPWQYDTYPPSVPTGVNAVAASTTQINLSWSASTDDVGVAGYNIYRDGIFLKSVSTTSASDTGLSPDTQYCYTVSAYDAAGNESGWSDEVCATTTVTLSYVILKSATPQTNNMQFDYDGAVYDTYYTDPPHWKIINFDGYMQFSFNGKNDFTFHALGSTSGGISYCHVKVYVNGNVYWSDKFIDKNWTDYIIPSSSFTTGSNTVKIVLIGDTHFWIDEASAVGSPWQYDTYPPSIPTGVNAVTASTTQINLSWNESTDDVGVAGYNIYRYGIFLKSVSTTSASDTGLSPDTQYCYTVSAYDAAGNESGWSDEVCTTTHGGENSGIPNAPSNFTATPISSTVAIVEWQDNSNIEDGFRLESYMDVINAGGWGWYGTNLVQTSTMIEVPQSGI